MARRMIKDVETSKALVGTEVLTRAFTKERVKGIEPSLSAWEADVLPLNYTRERSLLYRIDRSWSTLYPRRRAPDFSRCRWRAAVVDRHRHLDGQFEQPPVDRGGGSHCGAQAGDQAGVDDAAGSAGQVGVVFGAVGRERVQGVAAVAFQVVAFGGAHYEAVQPALVDHRGDGVYAGTAVGADGGEVAQTGTVLVE